MAPPLPSRLALKASRLPVCVGQYLERVFGASGTLPVQAGVFAALLACLPVLTTLCILFQNHFVQGLVRCSTQPTDSGSSDLSDLRDLLHNNRSAQHAQHRETWRVDRRKEQREQREWRRRRASEVQPHSRCETQAGPGAPPPYQSNYQLPSSAQPTTRTAAARGMEALL